MATKSYGDKPRRTKSTTKAKKKPTLDQIATSMGRGSKNPSGKKKKKK